MYFVMSIFKTSSGGLSLFCLICYETLTELCDEDTSCIMKDSNLCFLLLYHDLLTAHSSALVSCFAPCPTGLRFVLQTSTMSALIVESAAVGHIVVFPSTLIEIQWRVVWLL